MLLAVASLLAGLPATPAGAQGCAAVTDKIAPWRSGDLRGANIWQGRWGGRSNPHPLQPIGNPVSPLDLAELRRLGAGYVQLSVAGLFGERPPYGLDAGVQSVIDRVVGLAGQAGLYVVLAFRTGPGRNEQAIARSADIDTYGPIQEDLWTDGGAQAAWLRMVQQAVRRYAGNPTVIGIDPLVEPNAYARHGFLGPEEFYATYGQTSEDVNLLHARATAAVRALSDVPLLLEGDGYGSLGYLPHLRITGDPRTVYTAHYYEPRAFTHQDPGAGLAYPGLLPIGSSPTRVDKAFQERQLAPLQAFKQQHGVPVAVTEFGVHRYAPGAAAYLTDAMSIFDAMGASSALWEFVVRAQRPLFNDFDPQGGPDPAVRIAVRNPVQAAVEDGLRARCVQPAPPLPAATSEPSGSRPPRSRVLPLLLVAVAAAGAAALATRRQWRRRRRRW